MNHILFKQGNYSIVLEDTIQDDVVELLKNTIWGTEGGMLYYHLDTCTRIYEIQSLYFLNLRKQDFLLATLALCIKDLPNYTGLYIRYFSFNEKYRVEEGNTRESNTSNSLFRRCLLNFFERPNLKLPMKDQQVFFAFVELGNERSMQLCKSMGFESIQKLKTSIFSRFFPKKSTNVSRILEREQKFVLERLKEFYKGYHLASFENVFKDNQYFVINKNGRAVVGVQAHKVNWVMKEVPGFTGQILKYVVPNTPLLSRLIDPNNYQFLAFEGLFFEKGSEHLIEELLESVCAELGTNSGIIWSDAKSDLYATMEKSSLGFLNILNEDISADIIAKFINFSTSEKKKFIQQPVYVSAFDLI